MSQSTRTSLPPHSTSSNSRNTCLQRRPICNEEWCSLRQQINSDSHLCLLIYILLFGHCRLFQIWLILIGWPMFYYSVSFLLGIDRQQDRHCTVDIHHPGVLHRNCHCIFLVPGNSLWLQWGDYLILLQIIMTSMVGKEKCRACTACWFKFTEQMSVTPITYRTGSQTLAAPLTYWSIGSGSPLGLQSYTL